MFWRQRVTLILGVPPGVVAGDERKEHRVVGADLAGGEGRQSLGSAVADSAVELGPQSLDEVRPVQDLAHPVAGGEGLHRGLATQTARRDAEFAENFTFAQSGDDDWAKHSRPTAKQSFGIFKV